LSVSQASQQASKQQMHLGKVIVFNYMENAAITQIAPMHCRLLLAN